MIFITRDNDFLHFGHRPALPSFAECFKSIFRIHTETGNIWTHLVTRRLSLILDILFAIHKTVVICVPRLTTWLLGFCFTDFFCPVKALDTHDIFAHNITKFHVGNYCSRVFHTILRLNITDRLHRLHRGHRHLLRQAILRQL